MKTIFDPVVRTELTERIKLLRQDSQARWGKMNVFRMSSHCVIWSEWVLGTGDFRYYVYKQDLLGKLFGKWALRSNTKDDKPIGKGMPAGKAFLTKDIDGDVEVQKALWAGLIDKYAHYSNPGFVHDFFGKMSQEQTGIFAYKHFDHHLRQFGV